MEKAFQRKAIRASLNDYDLLADVGDAIEITEWEHGGGFDVYINKGHTVRAFMITRGELKAIRKLTKKLDKWGGE